MKRVAAPPKQRGGNEAPRSLLEIQALRQVQRAEREEKGDCDEERPRLGLAGWRGPGGTRGSGGEERRRGGRAHVARGEAFSNRVPGPAAARAKVPRSVGSAGANPAAARAFHPRLDDEPGRTRGRASGRQGAREKEALAPPISDCG